MARISGVNLPNNKRIVVGLTYIHGIGRVRAERIISELGIDPAIRVADLSSDDETKIREFIDTTFKVEGDLRREVSSNIKRLREINTYRGDRHGKRLPVRGQRTKTNARTKRGKKVTMGSGRKKAAAKT